MAKQLKYFISSMSSPKVPEGKTRALNIISNRTQVSEEKFFQKLNEELDIIIGEATDQKQKSLLEIREHILKKINVQVGSTLFEYAYK